MPDRPLLQYLRFSSEQVLLLKRLAELLRLYSDEIIERRVQLMRPFVEQLVRRQQLAARFGELDYLRQSQREIWLQTLDSWTGDEATLEAYFEDLRSLAQTYASWGLHFDAFLGQTHILQTTALEAAVQHFDDSLEFTEAAARSRALEVLLRVYNRYLLTLSEVYLAQREEAVASERQAIIDGQRRAILELSTPIVPIFNQVLVLPIVGSLDPARAQRITEALLQAIVRHQAEVVIVDITGLSAIDEYTARALLQAARAARLLGARAILVGITSQAAQLLLDLEVDLSDVITLGNLQAGIEQALALRGYSIEPRARSDE
jgi:anti-anti-sigma regulatory factor